MSTRIIRDPYGSTFEIDATALPFWEHREGYTILPVEEPDEPRPEQDDTPKTSKRAARAAQEVKEQPDG
ncbi:hypothetical protein ACBJ59_36555 [Nonomuraea sp. MTCD27]|uniref:hypothetical protein n=1 Tax=Nonomuraea sp. MTCD27 TaxID=1676747 RepID=UPI0035BF3200